MADTRAKVEFDSQELAVLRAAFRQLPKNISARYLGAALRVASKPALAALRRLTPKGPTGNLRKSIASKVRRYKSGNAVALVGYQAANTDNPKARGFHQGFVEFGTKKRSTKGRYASTFRSKTPERAGPFQIVVARRGRSAGKMRTKPFPKSFFKAAKAGQQVDVGRMPVGGRKGQPPVKTAYQASLPEVRKTLELQMAVRLENALKDVADRAKSRGVGRRK